MNLILTLKPQPLKLQKMINSNPISIEDLPIRIQKQEDWISFQEHDQEVLKLTGKGKVGTAPSPVISLEDARLELKHYLRDGWEIKT